MRIQGLFLKRGLSLANPPTAAVHHTSMESMRLILSGALVTGVIDDRQHAVLAGMVDDVDSVPDCL